MKLSQLVSDYRDRKADTRSRILQAVVDSDGVIHAAAFELGVAYRTLHRLINCDEVLFRKVQSTKKRLRKEGVPQQGQWEMK